VACVRSTGLCEVLAYAGGEFSVEFTYHKLFPIDFVSEDRFLILLDREGTVAVRDLQTGSIRKLLKLKTNLPGYSNKILVLGDRVLVIHDRNGDIYVTNKVDSGTLENAARPKDLPANKVVKRRGAEPSLASTSKVENSQSGNEDIKRLKD
jgi:hypothetical protein